MWNEFRVDGDMESKIIADILGCTARIIISRARGCMGIMTNSIHLFWYRSKMIRKHPVCINLTRIVTWKLSIQNMYPAMPTGIFPVRPCAPPGSPWLGFCLINNPPTPTRSHFLPFVILACREIGLSFTFRSAPKNNTDNVRGLGRRLHHHLVIYVRWGDRPRAAGR